MVIKTEDKVRDEAKIILNLELTCLYQESLS